MIVVSPPHLELDVSLLSGEWVTFPDHSIREGPGK